MTNFKSIMVLLLVLVLTLSTVACDKQQPTANESTPSGEQGNEALKSYYEVFYDEGLSGALQYFDLHYANFDDETKSEFSNALKEELANKGELYKAFVEIERAAIPAPATLEYVDAFYPNVFSSERYTFNMYTLDDTLREISAEIEKDDLFSLCKAYWVEEGMIEDIGFAPVVNSETARIIKERLLENEEDQIENILSYHHHIGGLDTTFSSDETYPVVLVENPDKFDLFKEYNKVTLYVPVTIIDEPISDESPSSHTPTTDPASIPKDIAIKNYEGPGLDQLTSITYDFQHDASTTINKTLAVFGTIYDVEIGKVRLYTEGNTEMMVTYDELTDTLIQLNDCPFNDTEMSNYMVYVSFYDEDLNYSFIGFAGEYDKNDSFISSTDIKETPLKSNGPSKVSFDSGEAAILGNIQGSSTDFSALFLVENCDDFATENTSMVHMAMDSRLMDYYDLEDNVSTIPLWVSSNMYDVKVVYSNYGEVIETSSSIKNIQAGTWLKCIGILQGDGEAYVIQFKLKDGTQKEILITTSESDDDELINGYLIKIL